MLTIVYLYEQSHAGFRHFQSEVADSKTDLGKDRILSNSIQLHPTLKRVK